MSPTRPWPSYTSIPVVDSLEHAGLAPLYCTMPDGEAFKTLETLAGLYDQFVDGGLDRSGAVLALGGGVTCDVAGFAAATYMRGLPVIQVPTTLLAMVDASVGGKTAVDLPQGKNLVGAFKQPALVVIDPDVLATLPPPELASGMAELIKHGVLADVELFEELEQAAPSPDSLAALDRALAPGQDRRGRAGPLRARLARGAQPGAHRRARPGAGQRLSACATARR